jgi:NAD(P)-dependent dehydrogenase (short-subunit alcohol dehydrogenase family)
MFSVYAACKAAMISFTRSMSLELGEHQIRINAIAPDITTTPGMSGIRSGNEAAEATPAFRQAVENYIPLGRAGHISECGKLATFLCSPMASYITGVTIPIDGGSWASSGWNRKTDGTWGLFGSQPHNA